MTTAQAQAPQIVGRESILPRLWLPLSVVGLYWAWVGITYMVEMPTFVRFITHGVALIVVMLTTLAWWLFNRRVGWRDRLHVLGVAVAAPVGAMLLAHETMGPIPLFNGLPLLFTVWVAWLLVAAKASRRVWKGGLAELMILSMGVFTLFRMEGLKGEGAADLRWRWSATAEERYLAGRPAASGVVEGEGSALTLRPGDWPGFRGERRDSVVRGLVIETDWVKHPPRQVWRRPIGPGWSSMAIVDGRLFTQEQRGDNEAVVCVDAQTGEEIWSHRESGRFWDSLSSAGPRATPTFVDGKIYAQGATGILLCLDAATGKRIWSRNTLADAGATLPDWGVASSPLVSKGVAIVYSGGPGKKALMGYRADNGEIAWTIDWGVYSYTSPHLAMLAGQEQVLFISDRGLVSADPASGRMLWEYPAQAQPPRTIQPLIISDSELLVPLGMEAPTDLVAVTQAEPSAGFTVTRRWTSRNLKPSFNDFVLYQDHIYGYDGAIFTCVELKTGQRKWKKGRYGTGQALLLADQGVLVVVSDRGQVTLLNADPQAHRELGQFDAITGKTWNHPAIVGNRLYLRNAQEMACYELTRVSK